MKKSLLSLAGMAVAIAACTPTPKFTMQGTIEGNPSGSNVYLVKYQSESIDTLAKGIVTEGKFSLTGTADSLTDAYLLIEGQRRGLQVFLENAAYTVTLNSENPNESKIEGPANQMLANQYNEIKREARKAQEEIRKEYIQAAQANDTAKVAEVRRNFEELSKNMMEKCDALTQANPDSYVAAYMLLGQIGDMDLEEIIEKYEVLGENAKASFPGRKIADNIARQKVVAIGQVAPDFTLPTPTGDSISMHSIQGKVKLIDFWASWCGPCRGENPNVAAIYKDYQPKGLAILSVSLDKNKEAWQKGIEEDKLIWNNLYDEEGKVAKQYVVRGIPHLIILDENNVIIAKNLRGDDLRAKIAELLK